MLTELHVRQFALIEQIELRLKPGSTVFSGETGAGKSILVDALGAVFGARASSDWVRHGADQAEITAVLEDMGPEMTSLLDEIDLAGEDALILRRVITADGRSKAYVNGSPVPLKLLQRIGNCCLDLHGQHEHQALMHADFQLQLMDGRLPQDLLDEVREAYGVMQAERKQLEKLQAECEQSVRQDAWMREESARLQALELHAGVEEELRTRVESGRHFAQIQEAATTALTRLEDGDGNVREQLAQSAHALERAAEFRPELQESLDMLSQMEAILGEIDPMLRPLQDESFDAQSLEAAEQRLMDLHEAMRRHQMDEAGLIGIEQELADKIARLDTAGWDEDAQKKRLEEAKARFLAGAKTLSRERKQAAGALAEQLRPYLDRLALAGMKVRIDVETHSQDESYWSSRGVDEVRFMASSNPGEPFRELAAIASGGELSRLVLGLKGCGAMTKAPGLAVFDEVDVGIGGETAWCVGELLAAMGRDRQVLVVSHLPQVAACADHQVCIVKQQQGERTVTMLETVEADARLGEIARMLGGSDARSRDHAAQMLRRGQTGIGAA